MSRSRARKTSAHVSHMFSQPQFGANEIRDCDEILTQLWRLLLTRSKFNHRNWSRYLDHYIQAIGSTGMSFKKRNFERGNLSKALSNRYMTIRTFNRAMQFLKVQKYRLKLEAVTENGETIEVSSDFMEFLSPVEPIQPEEIWEWDEIMRRMMEIEDMLLDDEEELPDQLELDLG